MRSIIAVLTLNRLCETVSVAWQVGSVRHGLRVVMVWLLMAVPSGFGLMIFRLVQSFVRDLADLRAGRPVYEGERLFD